MEFKDYYKEAVNEMQPSQKLMENLIRREEPKTMRWNKKKTAIVALAACLLIGTTALAAGKISYYTSHASPLKEIKDPVKIEAEAKTYGEDVTLPKEFTNGYTLAGATPGVEQGNDENGKTVASGKFLDIRYVKDGAHDVTLIMSQILAEEDYSTSRDRRTVGDTNLYYYEQAYKFVPPSYKLTEEDEKAMESGELEISYGSDQVQETTYYGVGFDKGSTRYNLFSWDNPMTTDAWYQMAAELLE